MMIFAAVVRRVQRGFDHVAALHGETPVPFTLVLLDLRADVQATEELMRLLEGQQIVHVTFDVPRVDNRQDIPPSAPRLGAS